MERGPFFFDLFSPEQPCQAQFSPVSHLEFRRAWYVLIYSAHRKTIYCFISVFLAVGMQNMSLAAVVLQTT
jgi:hypothetical protein